MKQTVLIGLGGTGSRVVNNVARQLRKNAMDINDGVVTCAVLDTNKSDNDLIAKSGTRIPIIGTSKEMNIDTYMDLYSHTPVRTWLPYSKSFGKESMIDGASEMRVKSRLAFMDCLADGTIRDLEHVIESVFHERGNDKIRVMLVSSLSGGTGSGMFIQVALWLRKFFEQRNCQASLRGIFLLPDVFIRTVQSIQDNPRKKLYHYANAYAAIRELNAINKVIQKDYVPEKPIVIDDLFDSRNPGAQPVFDFSFFIDDVDARGASFSNMGTYEEMAAQLVYMQLYAPMVSELFSVEDNLYRSLAKSSEPLYGSCGTAKAVYPVEDVTKYCALRASRDSLVEGWNKIDSEIDALIEEQKAAERDGIVVEQKISRRDKFIQLFDEKSQKKGTEIGRSDRLFVAIRKDAFNERREKTEKGFVDVPECKIASFMAMVDHKIQQAVSANGRCDDISNIGEDLPDPQNAEKFSDTLVNNLKSIRDDEEETIKNVIENFEKNAASYAEEIIRAILPLDMGSVREENAESVYGLLVKKDLDGGKHFVHPVAAKYLLYKLLQDIEKRQKELTPESSKQKALDGDDIISFDNPKTRKAETLQDYWKQVGWHVSKSEIAHFISVYKEYNMANKLLCMQYETQLLSQLVLKALNERITELVKQIESLFKFLPDLVKKLDDEIAANIEANEQANEKVIYVNAKRKYKEAKYDSLGLDVTAGNSDLNKSVVNAVYGKFCYGVRPAVKENAEYANVSVISSVHSQIVASFLKLLKKDYQDQLNLNICKAIAEESDVDYKDEIAKAQAEEDPFGEHNAEKVAAHRHQQAIREYLDKLDNMAVPFLIARPEASLSRGDTGSDETIMTTSTGQKLRMPIKTELTFWGFHPDLVKEYPDLESDLGANKATAANAVYGVNELYCYRSIYGIKAAAIPKFNEMMGGDYFRHYDAVIQGVIKDHAEIDTPHLDKTWHEFLPYVSAEKQRQTRIQFYKSFWMGIAYGVLKLDNHRHWQLTRRIDNDFGGYTYDYEVLQYEGRPVDATDIGKLMAVLRAHPAFEMEIIPRLAKLHEEDMQNMTTYVGTKLISGLTTKGDLNPVTMIVRYSTSRGSDKNTVGQLIGSLEELLYTVANQYNMNRTEEQVNEARYRLCHLIYTKAERSQGKQETFGAWNEIFAQMKLGDTSDVETE